MIRCSDQPDEHTDQTCFTCNSFLLYLFPSITTLFSPIAPPPLVLSGVRTALLILTPLPGWSSIPALDYNYIGCKIQVDLPRSGTCSSLIAHQLKLVVRFVSCHCLHVSYFQVCVFCFWFCPFSHSFPVVMVPI